MRKDLFGIIFFFLVIFILISLLSYSPSDPSINHATASGHHVKNVFGLLGAHVSGVLVALFGLGAFWIPALLVLSCIHFVRSKSGRNAVYVLFGGIFLVITTGSLFALRQNHYVLFGSSYSSGGIIGIPFQSFLVKYSNGLGAVIILLLVLIIGLVMATGFSPVRFARSFLKWASFFAERLKTLLIKLRERRKKVCKRKKKMGQTANNDLKIKIKTAESKHIGTDPAPRQEVFEFMNEEGFKRPSENLLDNPEERLSSVNDENLMMQSKLLEKKLEDFNVKGKVMAVSPGPVITTFEYEPAPGVKINKIVNLSDDLALALRATSIRIVAPIPGKAVIGIEIPNPSRHIVRLKEIVVSKEFKKSTSGLALCLGKDIVGNPVVVDLAAMPHLLIAGATGTGKSIGLNAMICSLLFQSNPDDVKLIMIDPKRIELSIYNGIPHLITPVVTDVKKATNALFWAVGEMERRYEKLTERNARNIKQYNKKINSLSEKEKKEEKEKNKEDSIEKLPYVVIIIDELADLMMTASRDVEVALTRLSQMARASGIHLILATQRPSVDVLTGVIKANFPTRLTFQVTSRTDSRTIIDSIGAENLLGNGDMLLLPPGTAKLQRIHGAYISEEEITRITDFIKKQKAPTYNKEVMTAIANETTSDPDTEQYDEKYDDAVDLVTRTGQASISMVQRQLRIGYNRAARIVETMEKEGVVGPSDGVKPRKVIAQSYESYKE
jgi:S-DNA-T family DNA segregation ATPase FtsK/SpoIIIE